MSKRKQGPWWVRSVRDASPDERRDYAACAAVFVLGIGALYAAALLRLMGWW